MKKQRIVWAGVLAGLAVFFWGMLSHTVLGIGEMAIKTIPNEQAVLSTLHENIKEGGFYFFPGGMVEAENAPEQQQDALMKQYEKTYRTQPHGILIFSPPTGEYFNFPELLTVELASNVLGGLLAACLLSFALGSLHARAGRILFVTSLGVFASLAIDVSHWNWYDFPTKYLISSLIDNTIGWAMAGVVLAFLMKPKTQ